MIHQLFYQSPRRFWSPHLCTLLLVLFIMLALTLPAHAQGGESITAPDTVGAVGTATSLALDSNGYPVVSYTDETNLDLKVLHCNDANCDPNVNGPESITSPDTAGNVGGYTALALDSNGYPVVSYADFTNLDLKVLHCNDANCDPNVNGAESITSPDTAGEVGWYISLALDSNGFPVVSYWDITNDDLKLLHCNDANCDPNVNGAESITSPDTAGNVGEATSLVLDSNDFPVVSYYDRTNGDLKLLRCNDPNCDPNVNGAESITSPDTAGNVGWDTSLVLDSNGFPVVSYYDRTNMDLKLLRCNDPNCDPNVNGAESITSPDTSDEVGEFTSLVLNSNGYPVVSYYDKENADLKLLHCNDSNCDPNVNGAESITAPDTSGAPGEFTSLALDSNGYPVVSYFAGVNEDLRVIHCNDPDCANAAPVAVDDAYSTDADAQLDVAAPGVLGNDSDTDGDTLTAVLASDVSNGTLILNADGSFSYIPNAGFTGNDSFTYVANDGAATSNSATVTITVNTTTAPFATCGGYAVFETAPGVYEAPSFPGNLMVGTDSHDWLIGANGPDLMLGLQGPDDLWGGDGDDVICGGAGVDIILGMKGNDTIYGGDQPDWLIGGPDNDTLFGGEGNDDLFGNSGNDTLHGEAGKDVLAGGLHDDILHGGEDDDNLYGNLGDDDLLGGPAADFCRGGFGSDTIAECEGASAADASAEDKADIDEEAARRSNDGENGENGIEKRIQQIFLPLVIK